MLTNAMRKEHGFQVGSKRQQNFVINYQHNREGDLGYLNNFDFGLKKPQQLNERRIFPHIVNPIGTLQENLYFLEGTDHNCF